MELEKSEAEMTAEKEKAELSLQQIPAGISRVAVRVRRHVRISFILVKAIGSSTRCRMVGSSFNSARSKSILPT